MAATCNWRSRNDLGQALARMALRRILPDLHADLLALRRLRSPLARCHPTPSCPATPTPSPQPVTFAHYLAASSPSWRKTRCRAYANVNESSALPFHRHGLPIDRFAWRICSA